MRKLVLIVLLLQSLHAVAQTPDMNMQKYWYLRWRLRNYFMVVGPNYGEGFPAGIRNKYGDVLTFGDAANYLANYIGVLATEIRLAKIHGLEHGEATKELYYALYAINRWDDCETHYPWGGFDMETYDDKPYPDGVQESEFGDYLPNASNLNGACLRTDAPRNFVHKNFDKLNANLGTNFTSGNFGGLEQVNTIYNEGLNPLFFEEGEDPEFTYGYLTYEGMRHDELNGDEYEFRHPIDRVRYGSMLSQDHIASLLMGLSFVTKSLNSSDNYNDTPFQDGTINFVQEAQNIAHRLISYMTESGFHLKLIDEVEIKKNNNDWELTNEINTGWGGNAVGYATGHAAAAARVSQNPIDFFNPALDDGSVYSTAWALAGDGGNIPIFLNTSVWIYLKLLATGNRSGGIFNSTEANQDKIYFTSEGNDLHLLEDTYDHYDWKAFYPLIHSYLNDTPCKTENAKIISDLNSMNCAGHYYKGGATTSDWGSSVKYHSGDWENDHGGFDGNFTGLEYMLLMNLFLLEHPSYLPEYRYLKHSGVLEDEYPKLVTDLAYLNTSGPGLFQNTTVKKVIGAQMVPGVAALIEPAHVYSIDPIHKEAINLYSGPFTIYVNPDGNNYNPNTIEEVILTFWSYITNNPGIEVIELVAQDIDLKSHLTVRSASQITIDNIYMDPGAQYFELQNDPYECNTSGTGYQMPTNDNMEANKGTDYTEKNKIADSLNQLSFGEISVAPNPTKGFFSVNKKRHVITKITVLDILGHVVYETDKIYDETFIDLSEKHSGMYIVICSDGSANKTFKIIKD